MPARQKRSLKALRAREAREREQSRLRSARYRERHRDENGRHGDVTVTQTPVTVTAQGFSAPAHEGTDARSTSFLVTSLPSVKREDVTSDFERVDALLAAFRPRGDVPTRPYLERLQGECPRVDLVAAAMEAAQWLRKPDNLTRECNNAFFGRWVRKNAPRSANAQPDAPGSTPPRPKSALGRVLQQIATDPVAGPSTWH